MTEDATARYYRENAKTYADRTRNLDLSILRDAFLRALPNGRSEEDGGSRARTLGRGRTD